ncbi:dynamin family protein [Herbiconiux daphne]|uniref:Dynamin family protein n=1 Tax=Herbiconiux daphne TaxID=2970914 RepID=A0ABT2GXG5_9MICO|nr:dynamin family protein [Herbiconiux daphne]MCS5732654.1 dynamin family protein [Herbiconiux daphne]
MTGDDLGPRHPSGDDAVARLRRRLKQLCDDADRLTANASRATTSGVRMSLTEPLRLAVVGRVKAGKSTLINALIGRRVAPTDEAECTRIVTHYRHGSPERGELHLLSGEVVPLRLVHGRLPDELGRPVDEVSHAVVHLPERALEGFTLIDTPGLSTTTAENERATRRAILGEGGSVHADALIYVFSDVQFADDVRFLAEFAAVSGKASSSTAASIGVLSHADTFGSGAWGPTDPVADATEFAAGLARQRAAELGEVLAVAGNLGEAGAAGLVTEQNARDLAAFASATDDDLRYPLPADDAGITALRERVGDYGLRFGRERARQGAGALSRWLIDVSGADALFHALEHRYVRREAQLKARQALDELRDAPVGAAERLDLLRLIDGARSDAELHLLNELEAWEALVARHPGHPLVGELERMMEARDDAALVGVAPGSAPADVRGAALALASQAQREAALTGDSLIVSVQRVRSRSFTLVLERLEAAGTSVPRMT